MIKFKVVEGMLGTVLCCERCGQRTFRVDALPGYCSMTLQVSCPKCGDQFMLTDDDAVKRVVAAIQAQKVVCADCAGPLWEDGLGGPVDGWELEDGRTVCHACCVKELRALLPAIREELARRKEVRG